MLLAPYYREFELPWEGDEESNERFRKILRVLLIILLLFGILFPLLPRPKHTIAEEVPERLARVMTQTPKPPPPPPPKPKEEEKPKIEPKVAIKPPPVDERQRAHEKAQKQLNQVKDELADLRDVMDLTPLETTRHMVTSPLGAMVNSSTSFPCSSALSRSARAYRL